MKNRTGRSIRLRALNALCATLLFISVIYIMITGFHFVAMTALAFAITGAATPVVLSGEGVLEIVLGTFEAMIDGVLAIIEVISNAVSSLFG